MREKGSILEGLYRNRLSAIAKDEIFEATEGSTEADKALQKLGAEFNGESYELKKSKIKKCSADVLGSFPVGTKLKYGSGDKDFLVKRSDGDFDFHWKGLVERRSAKGLADIFANHSGSRVLYITLP